MPSKPRENVEIPKFPDAVCKFSQVASAIMIPAVFPLVYGVPALVLFWGLSLALPTWAKGLGILLSPLAFSALVVLMAGLISVPCRPAVVRAKFPHDLGYPLYAMRRIYGIALCAVLYFRPVYHLILLVQPLKTLFFRLFGYRGSMDFTTYPDTWIRDLAMLDFGKGAYIANRVTLGTNIVLMSGEIYVDRITIGENSVVGHLSFMGPACRIGHDTEIGVAVDMGMGITIGDRTKIGPTTGIDHGCKIGNDVTVGTRSHLGKGCRIHDGIRLPNGSIVPDKTELRVQADVDRLLTDKTQSSKPPGRHVKIAGLKTAVVS